MLKTKSKRERSVSIDSVEERDAITPVLEPDAKVEGVMRSKRRCVLEKKQPYSGDEWCSGPDTEEDEDKLHTAAHRECTRERAMAGPIQALSGPSSTAGPIPESGGPAMGRGLGPGLYSELPRTSQQMFVFTTSLANSAAEAVIHGHTDSIILFHQQNVPCTKLEQCTLVGKLPSLSEQMSTNGTPPMSTPKSQGGTPRPASVGGGVGGHLQSAGTPLSTGHTDSESQARPSGVSSQNTGATSHQPGGGSTATTAGACPRPGGGNGPGVLPHPTGISPSASPSVLSAHLQGDPGQRSSPGNSDGLSKEQLKHRELSLQTLRDIERLLLRSGTRGGPGEPGGPNSNPNDNNNTDGSSALEESESGNNSAGNCNSNNILPSAMPPMKKYEEPFQSIISQTQSLGGHGMDNPQMGPHHNLSPGLDMGALLGHDGLTPEQMAWRKLQEEYYQEKRRQQEIQPHTHPQHFRMMSELGMQGGPPMMMRGPPPPYHSKPREQQWGAGPMMGGNACIIDMYQEGPRGPRFLGQIQRGPSGGGGFPGSPGGLLSTEGLGPQRASRPGMSWLDDRPLNMGAGGPFHDCFPPGGPGGLDQHLQADPDRLLTREEMFCIMEKRQLQGLHRLELDQLAKQQQGGLGPRLMDNPGGPGFRNTGMGRGPPSHGEPMDFPVSRDMMGSPGGGGPQMRDLVDSPMGGNLNMNPHMSIQQQQQQQMMIAQKLRAGPSGGGPLPEMLSHEEILHIRASQNGREGNKCMIPGLDGPLHFPNQIPFPGGQVEGGYLQQPGPDQQGPTHMGGTPRLSHMPRNACPRGADLGPHHRSDLSVNVNPMVSPVKPPSNQVKSPSLNQELSSIMPSSSTPGLKSPSQISSTGPHLRLPAASGAGTPSSTSMKSPQVIGPSSLGLRSPSSSPGQLKSPAMSSPKTALPSSGPPSGKGVSNSGSSSTEMGPSLPPSSSNSTPISQPGSMNPSMPFTTSTDAPPSQNPLSLIMSQMSKYAMPSSTPLYHDAIKTIATSDDEMLPGRPLLSGVNIGGNHQTAHMLLSQSSMGPHSGPQSPIGIVLQGQPQLSHDPSGSMLSSSNHMGMPGMNPAMMGRGGHPDGMGSCNVSPMHPQNQMAGFPRMQHPSHGPLHSPIGGMQQQFSQPNEELSKGLSHQRLPHHSDSFPSMTMGDGPDLSEVIRPSHTGIPEFDLSGIIPSDKPSSTLQYFPKSEGISQPQQNPHQDQPSQQPPPPQLLKQLSSSGPPHSRAPSFNPHIANLQNMMAEQQPPPHLSHCGMRSGVSMPQGGSRGMISGGGMGPICHPGHMMCRTGMGPQQQLQQQHHTMMANSLLHHRSHPHPAMIAQQNLMMMQAKQRGMSIPGNPFGPQRPLMSPQGTMMGPPHPQSGIMGPQSLWQRGMSLDSPIGYGPGNMANMPF